MAELAGLEDVGSSDLLVQACGVSHDTQSPLHQCGLLQSCFFLDFVSAEDGSAPIEADSGCVKTGD